MRLSGGEAQRLSIARALLHHPSMLILDEPTTHLDAESVAHLLGALDSWSHTLTIIMISHDPAIRSFARQVYQLEHGRLREV
jgi:ATP-binding cassette subfamily C protein